MAQRGGKRPGAGRKKGVVSEAKRALASIAQEHAETALNVLIDIAKSTTATDSARVSAANSILDRGYGKPPQAVTGADGGPVEIQVRTLADFYRGSDT
jgi:HEAT repeat protein